MDPDPVGLTLGKTQVFFGISAGIFGRKYEGRAWVYIITPLSKVIKFKVIV